MVGIIDGQVRQNSNDFNVSHLKLKNYLGTQDTNEM